MAANFQKRRCQTTSREHLPLLGHAPSLDMKAMAGLSGAHVQLVTQRFVVHGYT